MSVRRIWPRSIAVTFKVMPHYDRWKYTARSDDAQELIELGHLAAAIGHSVINAFSAIVSNAELLRSQSIDASDCSELDNLASGIVETSLDASQIAQADRLESTYHGRRSRFTEPPNH